MKDARAANPTTSGRTDEQAEIGRRLVLHLVEHEGLGTNELVDDGFDQRRQLPLVVRVLVADLVARDIVPRLLIGSGCPGANADPAAGPVLLEPVFYLGSDRVVARLVSGLAGEDIEVGSIELGV